MTAIKGVMWITMLIAYTLSILWGYIAWGGIGVVIASFTPLPTMLLPVWAWLLFGLTPAAWVWLLWLVFAVSAVAVVSNDEY